MRILGQWVRGRGLVLAISGTCLLGGCGGGGGATSKDLRAPVIATQPPAIATATLPGGEVRDPYLATIQASGGAAPYAWSVVAGALPAGIALAPSTASSVDVRGAAAAAGTFTFTIRVEDARGRTADAQYTVRFDDIERYVYGGRIDDQSHEQIYMTERVNGAPSTPRQLIDNVWTGSFGSMVPLSTSPDGRYVATIMDRNINDARDLFVVDLRGSGVGRIRQVNGGAIGNKPGQHVSQMIWSADSRWIAFIGDVATAAVQDVFVADVTVPATMTARNITSYAPGQTAFIYDLAFTADSRHIVFIGDTSPNPLQNPAGWVRELFFADLASPAPAPVRLSLPLSDPANMDVERFTVAASGRGSRTWATSSPTMSSTSSTSPSRRARPARACA